ncbi:hypothetical protein K469DRAFT_726578 [Zopfia rhizophila CBS 207.26]|uniref:Uncharacterized protein n=1 Tax=Zopfia rhizophila CBS 207.26 TaxID=1314779 RepID=A0A6A6E3U2_9PEZI|nr:hypothetical protein K469DRAFT_726578 [Zopfia rhizophila CBS 207.26]
MGNQQFAIHVLAPLSFLYDFAAQKYGIFSKPNMLDVHNQNLAAFSLQPVFIAGFFFPQQFDGMEEEKETMRSTLFYISTLLLPLDTSFSPNFLTHTVAKTFASIGVGFAAAASVSDWTSSGCLVYDLVALSIGQKGGWNGVPGGYAAMTAGIVGLRNWFYPRWKQNKVEGGYSRVGVKDDEGRV